MQVTVSSPGKPSRGPMRFVIDNAVRYISFQRPSQMTTACHWPKAIVLNGTLYQMEMIPPHFAWVSQSHKEGGGDGYWLDLNILYSLWKQLLVMPPLASPKPAVVYWEWYGTNLSWNQFKSKLGVLSVMCPEGLCLGILYHASNLVNQIKLQSRWDQTVALTRDKRLEKSRGFIFQCFSSTDCLWHFNTYKD